MVTLILKSVCSYESASVDLCFVFYSSLLSHIYPYWYLYLWVHLSLSFSLQKGICGRHFYNSNHIPLPLTVFAQSNITSSNCQFLQLLSKSFSADRRLGGCMWNILRVTWELTCTSFPSGPKHNYHKLVHKCSWFPCPTRRGDNYEACPPELPKASPCFPHWCWWWTFSFYCLHIASLPFSSTAASRNRIPKIAFSPNLFSGSVSGKTQLEKIFTFVLGTVAHACKPSYSGGWGRSITSSRVALATWWEPVS